MPTKFKGSKGKGRLLILRWSTNWDLIGGKEVPKQQAVYCNLDENLWGPHTYGCLSGVQVRTVVSGSCTAHSLLINMEGVETRRGSWEMVTPRELKPPDSLKISATK